MWEDDCVGVFLALGAGVVVRGVAAVVVGEDFDAKVDGVEEGGGGEEEGRVRRRSCLVSVILLKSAFTTPRLYPIIYIIKNN